MMDSAFCFFGFFFAGGIVRWTVHRPTTTRRRWQATAALTVVASVHENAKARASTPPRLSLAHAHTLLHTQIVRSHTHTHSHALTSHPTKNHLTTRSPHPPSGDSPSALHRADRKTRHTAPPRPPDPRSPLVAPPHFFVGELSRRAAKLAQLASLRSDPSESTAPAAAPICPDAAASAILTILQAAMRGPSSSDGRGRGVDEHTRACLVAILAGPHQRIPSSSHPPPHSRR